MDWVFWVLFFFSLSRLWVHLAICSKIKSRVVGLIFRDLGHREVDVGGEIVSYNFRCFKSLSQNLQPPTPFPEVFWGPSPSPHLALHPSIHAARFSPTHSSLNSGYSSCLGGSLLPCFMHCCLYLPSDYFHSSLKCSCKLLTDITCLLPSPWHQTQSCGLRWHLQHSRQVEIV